MAKSESRVLVATILGILVRCLFIRSDGINAVGRCKSSWIAEVFEISERQGMRAKRHLTHLGWIRPVASSHWDVWRLGARLEINLEWSQYQPAHAQSNLSPKRVNLTTDLSPPVPDGKLSLRRYKNHELARGEVFGFFAPERKAKKPNIRNIVPDDFTDMRRALELYNDAVAKGICTDSECGRLNFLTAMNYAQRKGKSPCKLLARLLLRPRLYLFSAADEDAANKRLRAYLYPEVDESRSRLALAGDSPLQPSSDAKLAKRILSEFESRGIRQDFLSHMNSVFDWTPTRSRAALDELKRNGLIASREVPEASVQSGEALKSAPVIPPGP